MNRVIHPRLALIVFALFAGCLAGPLRAAPEKSVGVALGVGEGGWQAASTEVATPVVQRFRFASATRLEQALDGLAYEWPPRAAVPVLEVQAFPSDVSDLPVARKKALFFRSLLPLVLAENRAIRDDRQFLIRALASLPELSDAEERRLGAIAERYRVRGDLRQASVQARLLNRVDELPPALVLAQAANESGWGTSRFAREANNLFGMWTYNPRLGLVPANRDSGKRHRVRAYRHLGESVAHYMLTVNRLPAYRELRATRALQRERQDRLDARELAQGLLRYSERGQEYVDEIRSMIRHNRLQRVDGSRLQG